MNEHSETRPKRAVSNRKLSQTARTKADRIARRLGLECDGADTKEQLRALQRAAYELARTLGTGYSLEELPAIAGLYAELVDQTDTPGSVYVDTEELSSISVYGLNMQTFSGEFETLGSNMAVLVAGAVKESSQPFDIECQDGNCWVTWNPPTL